MILILRQHPDGTLQYVIKHLEILKCLKNMESGAKHIEADNGWHFADNIFNLMFLTEELLNYC